MKLLLIRHGMTLGNTLSRYIGTTDEPLCPEGKNQIRSRTYPPAELIFSSPMLRCLETARLIYPESVPEVIKELAECDFGEFENRNYLELGENQQYQKWIDSNGTLPFPGGESREAFRIRCLEGFHQAVTICLRRNIQRGALVIHGGTIMNILAEYARPEKDFYQWHVRNGEGYQLEICPEEWKRGQYVLKNVKKIPFSLQTITEGKDEHV